MSRVAGGFVSQRRRSLDGDRRRRAGVGNEEKEEENDDRAEEVDEEEEEDERKKNRGLLEMLSQLPGRRGREKTNGYLHTQLRALVSRQHLCLWREDHVLLGLSEGHLEIILDVLATGVKETREKERGKKMGKEEQKFENDAAYVHPCLEVLSRVITLCMHRNSKADSSISEEKKEIKRNMMMAFFWGNMIRMNLLFDVLFTVSNDNSHLLLTSIMNFLIDGRRVFFDKFCSFGCSFVQKIRDDMQGYHQFVSKRTGVCPSAFLSLTRLLLHILTNQIHLPIQPKPNAINELSNDVAIASPWSPKSALSMLTLLCKVGSIVKACLDERYRMVDHLQHLLLPVLLRCVTDGPIAAAQKINALLCAILSFQTVSPRIYTLLGELVKAIQSKLSSDDVGLSKLMKFPAIQYTSIQSNCHAQEHKEFYVNPLNHIYLKKITLNAYSTLIPLIVMPIDRESASQFSVSKFCRSIATVKEILKFVSKGSWSPENVDNYGGEQLQTVGPLLYLQEPPVPSHREGNMFWAKACFGSDVSGLKSDAKLQEGPGDSVHQTKKDQDTSDYNAVMDVSANHINDNTGVNNKVDSTLEKGGDEVKIMLMEQVEKDLPLLGLCKALDSWTSMMLLAMSNSRTGKYVQPSEIIDVKWPLLSKVLIAMMFLKVAGAPEFAKYVDVRDFCVCLAHLLKHLESICVYLFDEACKMGHEDDETSLMFIKFDTYKDLFELLLMGYVNLVKHSNFTTQDSNSYSYADFESDAVDLASISFEFISIHMNQLEDFDYERLCCVLHCLDNLCEVYPMVCISIVTKHRIVLLDQAWIRSLNHTEILLLLLKLTRRIICEDACVAEMTQVEYDVLHAWLLSGIRSSKIPVLLEGCKCIIYGKKIFTRSIHHSCIERSLLTLLEQQWEGMPAAVTSTSTRDGETEVEERNNRGVTGVSIILKAIAVYITNATSTWNENNVYESNKHTNILGSEKFLVSKVVYNWTQLRRNCLNEVQETSFPRFMSFVEIVVAYYNLLKAKYGRGSTCFNKILKGPEFEEMLSEFSLILSRVFNLFVERTKHHDDYALDVVAESFLGCILRGLLLVPDLLSHTSGPPESESDSKQFSAIKQCLKCVYVEIPIDIYCVVVEYLLCLHESPQSEGVSELTIAVVSEVSFPKIRGKGRYTSVSKETADKVLLRLFEKFGGEPHNNMGTDVTHNYPVDLFSDLFARGVTAAFKSAACCGRVNIYTAFHFTRIISRLSNSNETVKQLLTQDLSVFDALHDCMQICLCSDEGQQQKSRNDVVYSILAASAASVTFLTNNLQRAECAIEKECLLDLILCLEKFEIDLKLTASQSNSNSYDKLSVPSPQPSPAAAQGCIIGCFRALKSLSEYQACVSYIQTIEKAEIILCNAANRLYEVIEGGGLVKAYDANAITQMMDELLGVTTDPDPHDQAHTHLHEHTRSQSNAKNRNKVQNQKTLGADNEFSMDNSGTGSDDYTTCSIS